MLPATNLDLCPYLGLSDDRESRCTFPTDTHRCYQDPQEQTVTAEEQREFCLTKEHERCERFLKKADGEAPRQRPSIWLNIDPRDYWHVQFWVVVALLLAIPSFFWVTSLPSSGGKDAPPPLVGGVATATQPDPYQSAQPVLSGENTATPAAAISSGPAPTAGLPANETPVSRVPATPSPRATPNMPAWATSIEKWAVGTPSAQRTRTPTPAGPVGPGPWTHTVVSGDTLSEIADFYDSSVDAIKKANNLKDNSLVPGMRLAIPAPSGR